MILDLKTQSYICALAECGNYRQAAERAFTTQPNLSLRVKRLEQISGMKLFCQKGRRTVPTEAGALMAAACRKMLDADAELERALKELLKDQGSPVRLGIFRILITLLEGRLIASFLKRFHHQHIAVVKQNFQTLLALLEKGDLDLIFCTQHCTLPSLEYVRIARDSLLVALPEGHPAQYHAEERKGLDFPWLHLKHLQEELFFIHPDSQQIQKETDAAFAFCGTAPARKVLINGIAPGVQAASEGIGAAFCMQSYVPAMTTYKPVRYFAVGDPDRSPWLAAAWMKGTLRTDGLEFCVEELRRIVRLHRMGRSEDL